jgi:hypothetical protein
MGNCRKDCKTKGIRVKIVEFEQFWEFRGFMIKFENKWD